VVTATTRGIEAAPAKALTPMARRIEPSMPGAPLAATGDHARRCRAATGERANADGSTLTALARGEGADGRRTIVEGVRPCSIGGAGEAVDG
jgi:hypothetical protein